MVKNIKTCVSIIWGFPCGSAVKNLPEMQESQEIDVGPNLSWEDPLEEDMATHSSIFAWRIPWTEEPGRPQSIVSQRVRHDQSNSALNMHQLSTLNEDGITLLQLQSYWAFLTEVFQKSHVDSATQWISGVK